MRKLSFKASLCTNSNNRVKIPCFPNLMLVVAPNFLQMVAWQIQHWIGLGGGFLHSLEIVVFLFSPPSSVFVLTCNLFLFTSNADVIWLPGSASSYMYGYSRQPVLKIFTFNIFFVKIKDCCCHREGARGGGRCWYCSNTFNLSKIVVYTEGQNPTRSSWHFRLISNSYFIISLGNTLITFKCITVRSKWNQLSSCVAFSRPALLRTLSDDEVAAVNVLFAETGLLPIDRLKEYSFAERLSVDGTVYHSAAYKRAGKSCSKIVQFFSQVTEPEHLFGEVQAFVTTGSVHLALLKQYPILASAISSLNINPPKWRNCETICWC